LHARGGVDCVSEQTQPWELEADDAGDDGPGVDADAEADALMRGLHEDVFKTGRVRHYNLILERELKCRGSGL
jgi:hypothetical protein